MWGKMVTTNLFCKMLKTNKNSLILNWYFKCSCFVEINQSWPKYGFAYGYPWNHPKSTSRQDLILMYWTIKRYFEYFSGFLTPGDLWWPRDYFFWKVVVKKLILIYNLPYFIKLQHLTYLFNFLTSGALVWPRDPFF